jgi:hypothetical protein
MSIINFTEIERKEIHFWNLFAQKTMQINKDDSFMPFLNQPILLVERITGYEYKLMNIEFKHSSIEIKFYNCEKNEQLNCSACIFHIGYLIGALKRCNTNILDYHQELTKRKCCLTLLTEKNIAL